MFKLKDFTVGQTAYIEYTGNASRGRTAPEDLIKECTVTAIGRKYVVADGIKFEEHNLSYGGLVEHSPYSADYVLYPTKEALLEKLEKEKILSDLTSFFGYSQKAQNLSLDKLRAINKIITE